MSDNILLVDKPKGITSFDVIRRLREGLGVKKMGHAHSTDSERTRLKIGHAGTLDPLASGLLIIGVGEGTKKLNEYLKLPKTYEVEILVGKRTATGDLEGEVVEETKDIIELNENSVKSILDDLVRERKILLPVPAYSAVKQKGEPLYKKARRDEEVKVPTREMEIQEIDSYDISYENEKAIITASMKVGSGAYIRSIAEEIGRRLEYPATVAELRRTKIGDFDVRDAREI